MLIAVSGASGSGKTSLSNYICSLNKDIVHLNIDEVGHHILEVPQIKEKILNEFNLKGDKVDRKELGNIVFNNIQKMDQL